MDSTFPVFSVIFDSCFFECITEDDVALLGTGGFLPDETDQSSTIDGWIYVGPKELINKKVRIRVGDDGNGVCTVVTN